MIHIWGNEWSSNKEKIKKFVLSKIGLNSKSNLGIQKIDNKIFLNRRFGNGKEFIEQGYELIDILEPKFYYTNYKDICEQENSFDRIWDCGSLVFKK